MTSAPTGRRRTPLLTRPWVGPLALVTVVFLAMSLPRYLGLDPSASRVPPREDFAAHYPLLVAHIFLGSVALVTCTLQVWPWLRKRHPAVHRWSGRLYVWAGVLPSGLLTLVLAPVGMFGLNQQVANVVLGLLWLATTVVGYRMARQRRYAEHREWMVRSFALAFSIVANRVWSAVLVPLLAPEALSATPDLTALNQAAGAATWLSWVVNLLIAEWWLQHKRNARGKRRHAARPPSGRTNVASRAPAGTAVPS